MEWQFRKQQLSLCVSVTLTSLDKLTRFLGSCKLLSIPCTGFTPIAVPCRDTRTSNYLGDAPFVKQLLLCSVSSTCVCHFLAGGFSNIFFQTSGSGSLPFQIIHLITSLWRLFLWKAVCRFLLLCLLQHWAVTSNDLITSLWRLFLWKAVCRFLLLCLLQHWEVTSNDLITSLWRLFLWKAVCRFLLLCLLQHWAVTSNDLITSLWRLFLWKVVCRFLLLCLLQHWAVTSNDLITSLWRLFLWKVVCRFLLLCLLQHWAVTSKRLNYLIMKAFSVESCM